MIDEAQIWLKQLPIGVDEISPIGGAKRASSIYARHIKRGFDVVFALLLAPVAVLIVTISALFVSRDGGSPFFSQSRVGKSGKTFTCWKLRTMVSDADAELARLCAGSDTIAQEWQVNQKLENDPRVTKIGKFLRKTHLDELPQLWNVLIGDMSVVGPRPFTPDQIQLYSSVGAKSYFSMRPGLTGPWQVSDRDAENNTFLARATYDEHYNHSASFSGDVKIVFQTILCVLKMRGQ